ncbi:hypothetical protein [Sinomonas sp. P10A9]|uniref:PE-PPE domain-containing protein n=1 Tax=Sinomonas puerhi TaxID=3238584 RepID=A0AB39L2E3_9MICC
MTGFAVSGEELRDPSTFVVTGGASFRVNLEALDTAIGALASAASVIAGLPVCLEAARAAVWRGACAGSASAAVFDDEAAALIGQAARAALDTRATARGVAAAASGYRAAEAQIAGAAGGHQLIMRGLVWGLVPPGLWRVPGEAPVREGAQSLRLLLGGASAVPPLVPWVVAGGPRDRISVVRSEVAAGSEDASTFAYAGRSLQQAQGAATLDDGTSVPPSSVLVERIPKPDASVAVIVTVPGTQTWSPDDPGGGIFDGEGNVDAMAGRDSHARQLIERALADQQLRAGDVVVFNAHSQGSLHVFGLLEDEDFRRRHPVVAVTVLGGVPTAFRVPDDVAVLSVANRDDVVPGLSGLPPVPRPNVVDVRTPSYPDVGSGGLLDAVVTAHGLDRYASDARELDASTDPSVRGYASLLGVAVGTGIIGTASAGAGAGPRRERFVYTGTDTTTPATPATPGAPSSSAALRPSPSLPRQPK